MFNLKNKMKKTINIFVKFYFITSRGSLCRLMNTSDIKIKMYLKNIKENT